MHGLYDSMCAFIRRLSILDDGFFPLPSFLFFLHSVEQLKGLHAKPYHFFHCNPMLSKRMICIPFAKNQFLQKVLNCFISEQTPTCSTFYVFVNCIVGNK